MENYKLLQNGQSVQCQSDKAFIPFAPANTDYQQFKKDIMAGGELQDADGAVMTDKAAKEFVAGLP